MIQHEVLHCVCGGEVGIVRLTPDRLAFGHQTNPRQNHHYVRLDPASRARAASPLGGADELEPERPAHVPPLGAGRSLARHS